MHKDKIEVPKKLYAELSKDEQDVYNLSIKRTRISDSEIANKLNLNKHKVDQIHKSLIAEKFIVRCGSFKGGHWEVVH